MKHRMNKNLKRSVRSSQQELQRTGTVKWWEIDKKLLSKEVRGCTKLGRRKKERSSKKGMNF